LDDLAAVVAGSKPAAQIIVGPSLAQHNSELKALLQLARERNLEISVEPQGSEFPRLLVGRAENVRALKPLLVHSANRTLDWKMLVEKMRLLGYHPKAMEPLQDDPNMAVSPGPDTGTEAWDRLPRYKKLIYTARGYLDCQLDQFRMSRTLKAIDHIKRASMPPERLGHASAPVFGERRHSHGNQGRS